MAGLVRGEVVVLPFPFSDLSQSKRRPALILTPLKGDDVILCQITSRTVKDAYSVPLGAEDFLTGNLHQPSNVRPNRIFTADSRLILYSVGRLKEEKVEGVVQRLVDILQKP